MFELLESELTLISEVIGSDEFPQVHRIQLAVRVTSQRYQSHVRFRHSLTIGIYKVI